MSVVYTTNDMTQTVGSSRVGSFTPSINSRTFDVHKEVDALEVLSYVHQMAIDSQVKNEIRDLMFDYRLNGDKESIKKLIAVTKAIGLTLVSSKEETEGQLPEEPVSVSRAIGSSRLTPVFSRKPTVTKSTETKSEKSVPAVPAAPTPVSEPPSPPPTPAAPTTPPPPPSTPPAQAMPTTAPVGEGVNARINEIKRVVNGKVGNPVHLIDIDNELGREYMAALLDAMKKANGGQSGEVATAMERLELAFATVMKILEKGIEKKLEPEVAPEPVTPSPPPVPTPEKTITQAESVAAPVEAVPPAPDKMPIEKSTATDVLPQSEIPAVSVPIRKIEPPTPPIPKPSLESVKAPVEKELVEEPSPLVSVAEEKKLKKELRDETKREIEKLESSQAAADAEADPLTNRAVTNGLKQLLSEWSLFKSSGIFGTGPNGIEHPLYKQISGLQMQVVVTGRFEDANPQIRQSISDYMNGWRYEEGVVYEPTETFEHYLRRVIKRILDRHNEKH